jgi:hypothetical protein
VQEFGASVSSVYRVAADYDLADVWEDRRDAPAATADRAADLAKRRTELQSGLLDDIAELRSRLFVEVVNLNVAKVEPTMEEVVVQRMQRGGAVPIGYTDRWIARISSR